LKLCKYFFSSTGRVLGINIVVFSLLKGKENMDSFFILYDG